MFAHSLGNNVFRYFLEWLKLEIAPKHYSQWLDEHIHAYFAVGMPAICKIDLLTICTVFDWLYFIGLITGAPLLGATETVKASLSGFTFGLPVAEVENLFH